MATRVESVTLKLREMIVSQELKPGSRVPERDLAQAFGVSRTPVRVALSILEAEGLVTGEANRGFVVCDFSIDDVLSAFDVRGALEGLAARAAVERGLPADTIARLEACVAEGERLVAAGLCGADDMRSWSLANDEFHGAIIEASGLGTLQKVHAFLSKMPLVAPVAILFTNDQQDDAQARMLEAHSDHIHILDALRQGEGARAEFLMREHAHRSRNHLGRLLRSGRRSLAPVETRGPARKKRGNKVDTAP
ncbi:MAG: GntR family transcriptional regulator [Blastomonas sp. CACIA14H2]|jgi:GntR family transcriptional regulator, vanillate catabolism transcriptional regulator|uniref:GntR family transcriptional regulator n=1 Tax=unclassified Blastomonas TaxID=2626550 RepID=UPI0003D0663B|nr:GntR family transcriptional regulator [Blastomonas sp. UPD001]ESZ89038.1 MAG: GntR family transcriptional regulator [Blastomonas sp. CACIA14H2]